MGKTGIAMGVLVLAVGAMGGAAAGFTDEFPLEADVNTASTGYECIGFAETWVYSHDVEGQAELLVLDGPADPALFPPGQYLPAGFADIEDREPGVLDDPVPEICDLAVDFNRVVPGADLEASVFVRYLGSIPVHLTLQDLQFHGGDELEDVLEVDFFVQAPGGGLPGGSDEAFASSRDVRTRSRFVVPEEEFVQLHPGDILRIIFSVSGEQDGFVAFNEALSTWIEVKPWNS